MPASENRRPFIMATYAMVSAPAFAQGVGWTDDGKGLEIRDVSYFCDSVLPHFFRHCNLASFSRQLNMYGFEKERYNAPVDSHVFVHPNFQRNRPDLLTIIERKPIASKSAKRSAPASSVSSADDEVTDPRITQLQSENERLELENKRLKDAIAEHFNFFNSPTGREADEPKEKQLLMSLLKADD